MYVNISRSKQLINNRRFARKARKPAEEQTRCNHCGGAVRANGELLTCIMCAREINHICPNCTHVRTGQVPDKNKKTA